MSPSPTRSPNPASSPLPVPDSFAYDHRGTELVYGRGSLDRLGGILADHGLDRGLVVCGSNVGGNAALMEPVREGLGDRLAGVFDGTTPAKTVDEAAGAVAAMRAADADVLVAVGGGSSLDVARQATLLAADGRSPADLRAAARAGDLDGFDADEPAAEVVVVPTTFAGADVSAGGSLELLSPDASPTDQPISLSGSARPIAGVYDPAAVATTPRGALAGSAMNGFDKGIETVHSGDPDPATDATAVHGLRLMRDGLLRIGRDDDGGGDGAGPERGDGTGDRSDAGATGIDLALAGILLVQLDRRLSVIHAFGHGFARRNPVQQGLAHAVMAPHVLEYLFDRVDARRDLLAAGLGVDRDGSPGAVAEGIVAAVAEVRDALGLPDRGRDLEGVDRSDVPAIAEFTLEDPLMAAAPSGLDPTAADLEAVLRAAW